MASTQLRGNDALPQQFLSWHCPGSLLHTLRGLPPESCPRRRRLSKFAAATTTTYGYNRDGLRMCKYAGSSTQPCQQGGVTQYLWDISGSLPLLLKDGAIAYIYGPGGLPVEQVNTSATYWFHHDQVGSTRLITNSTATTPHPATYTYDPFGGIASITESITNPFRFAGQYQDSESALYYLRDRYYDPSTGQFLSVDRIIIATRSPYRYVGNNPLNALDVTGLACATFICSGGVGVGGTVGAGAGIAGAQATGSANVGVFTGGDQGTHLGGTLSGAAFAYAGPYHACAPDANDNGNVGAVAGGGGQIWFSNATSASQLRETSMRSKSPAAGESELALTFSGTTMARGSCQLIHQFHISAAPPLAA